MKSYLSVKSETENETVIERSKFICYIKGIETEEEAKNFVSEIKKKNSLATHNCYAYIADELGLTEKFSDDGEPQGTAGKPMLEALKNGGYKKIVAVVTRYFGGIKLGTGGLSRAYGGAVSSCLKKAVTLNMQGAAFIDITCDYEGYNLILRLKNELNLVITNTVFGEEITISASVKEDFYFSSEKKILDLTKGKAKIINKGSGYFDFGGICR